MLRQVRRVLGEENLALSVMSQNLDWSRGYFGDARQVFLPDIFPPFLFREVRPHHGVIACEGSMFKSKFADALTTMFIGALGIAAAENKMSIGYGAEAGDMNPMLEKMCAHYCRRSLIITRNEESQTVLSKLGVPSEARHGHGLDIRAAPAGIRPQGADRCRMGRARLRCWRSARSIHSGGR